MWEGEEKKAWIAGRTGKAAQQGPDTETQKRPLAYLGRGPQWWLKGQSQRSSHDKQRKETKAERPRGKGGRAEPSTTAIHRRGRDTGTDTVSSEHRGKHQLLT